MTLLNPHDLVEIDESSAVYAHATMRSSASLVANASSFSKKILWSIIDFMYTEGPSLLPDNVIEGTIDTLWLKK